jgi:hypothetical protein
MNEIFVMGVTPMTDVPPPPPPQPPPGYAYVRPEYIEQRPLPWTATQAAGQAVGDVTSGLKRTPIALAVIVLNLLGIAAAVYFLNVLIKGQQLHMTEVIDADAKQFNVGMHSKEFDASLALAARNNAPPPSLPAVVPPPPFHMPP